MALFCELMLDSIESIWLRHAVRVRWQDRRSVTKPNAQLDGREGGKMLALLGSMRTRVICLVAFTIILTLVLSLYGARERFEHEMGEVHEAARQLVQRMVGAHDARIEETHMLLAALALFPSVREWNGDACREIFSRLQRGYASVRELAAVDGNGRIFCSSISTGIREKLVGADNFERLLDTRDVTMSGYGFSAAYGCPVMVLAHPVLDASHTVRAIVYAAMDLSWVVQVAMKGDLPDGASVLVIDNCGRILIRYPNPDVWTGRMVSEAPIVARMLKDAEGTGEIAGEDEVVRFYAYTTLWRTSPNYLHVAVGVPPEVAYIEVTKALKFNLLILGLLLVVGIGTAFWGTDFLVLRRVKGLLGVTRNVAEGNLSVRTGPPYARDELGELAQAFDGMSGALEQREREREETSKKIVRQSSLLEAVNRVLQETFTSLSVEDLAEKCLRSAQELTGSEMGFIGEVNGRGLFDTLAITDSGETRYGLSEPCGTYSLRDMEIRGMWGEALKRGSTVVVNDVENHGTFKYAPEGHPRLQRFMGVPLSHGDVVFGLICLGNKGCDYDGDDVTSIETLAIALVEALYRKRTEGALRKSEEEYRTLFESSRDAIILLDWSGFRDCNTAALEMFGCAEKDELLGKHPGDLAPGTQHDGTDSGVAARNFIERAFLEGVVFFEYDHARMDGSAFSAEILLSRIEIQGRTILQAVVRDTSRRKRLEERVRRAEKLEAVGTLAGGIAHDFNNVLGIVVGYAELMEESIPEAWPERKYLGEILKACCRAKDVIRQILMASRSGGEMERRVVDVGALLIETMKFMRASLPSMIEIRQKVQCDGAAVLMHPVQLHQIVTNLCTNAAHAMEERGGVLEVGLANADVESTEVRSPGDIEAGEYVVLSVGDNGHGMNRETMERIFDPYFTTKEVGKGSGLGLAVVHGIVQRLGGAVTVYSEVGRGTTFQVYLPRHRGRLDGERVDERPIVGGSERVLFVDDEAALVDVWQHVLRRLGYRVVAAVNGRDALEIFLREPESFDVVITDFTMPYITGTELAKEIGLVRPEVPVILCSGLSCGIVGKGAFEAPVRAVLTKPLNVRNTAETIRKVLDGRVD